MKIKILKNLPISNSEHFLNLAEQFFSQFLLKKDMNEFHNYYFKA